MEIFHCYVSLTEGMKFFFKIQPGKLECLVPIISLFNYSKVIFKVQHVNFPGCTVHIFLDCHILSSLPIGVGSHIVVNAIFIKYIYQINA